MNCSKCGSVVLDTDLFCESCGKPLKSGEEKVELSCNCPKGTSQPDEDGYCEVCGIRCVQASSCNVNTTKPQITESPDKNLAMVSDVGLRHPNNEDSGTVARGENDNVVLVVADGVSSSINASSASATAVKVARDILVSCENPDNAISMMRQAIEEANKAIVSLPIPKLGKDVDEPETTIVAALGHADQLVIGWVGDSRVYFVDQDSIELMTLDDSWIEEVVVSGEFTREQANLDKRAHCVTQVLGMRDEPINVHVVQKTVPEGKMVLMCSDGLWNYFQDNDSLAKAVRSCPPQADALGVCKHLVSLANDSGGHDNITVAVLMK